MRARNIKPGFYHNEELAECSFAARLLYPGLWMLADRAGRLEYRPKRWKAEIFPYDNVETVELFAELESAGLVRRYDANGSAYVWIPKFLAHQKPHLREKASTIPAHPDDDSQSEPDATAEDGTQAQPRHDQGDTQAQPRQCPARLNPESGILNPDILNPEEENTYAVSDAPKKKSATRTRHKYTPEYEVFYAKFPARHGQKNGKLPGQKAYAKALARPGITPEYLLERITALAPQYGDYPPDIATWLNNERWTDQVATTPPPPASRGRASPADLLEKNVQNMRGWIGHQPGDEHDEQRQTQICSGAFGHGGHL